MIARFSSLGPEARQFMVEAGSLEGMLNYFYWECSPYLKEFENKPPFKFRIIEQPEIGLPTVESTDKKGTFAMLKKNMRMKRMQTDDPHFKHLVEAVSNLGRAI